jgi:S1-C subfamily serine protease
MRARNMNAKSNSLNSRALIDTGWKIKLGLGLGITALTLVPFALEIRFDSLSTPVLSSLFQQPAKVPGRAAAVDLSKGFSSVSKQVEGAVVNVNSEQTTMTSPQEEMFRRFFGVEGPFGNIPRNRRERSLGSGFVEDSAG